MTVVWIVIWVLAAIAALVSLGLLVFDRHRRP